MTAEEASAIVARAVRVYRWSHAKTADRLGVSVSAIEKWRYGDVLTLRPIVARALVRLSLQLDRAERQKRRSRRGARS